MKKIALVLCLLLLVSCGAQTVDPATDETKRTSEQQLVDKHLTTILREQLSGAYDVKDATFTYANTEELEGKECFTYEMKKGIERLAAAGVVNYSLSNFNTLVGVAVEKGYIAAEDEARLKKFMANPQDESWMNK